MFFGNGKFLMLFLSGVPPFDHGAALGAFVVFSAKARLQPDFS